MKKSVTLALLIAISTTGCAAAGGVMNSAGNWLEGTNTSLGRSVGGFYKDMSKALTGEDKKEDKKQ